MNSVKLIGNLGGAPELRYTGTGRAVCDMSVATSDRYTNAAGERVETTHWHLVRAWGNTAERAAQLTKGAGVLVIGSQQTEKWQDRQGVDRFTTRVIARRIDQVSPLPPMPGASDTARSDAPGQGSAPAPAAAAAGQAADAADAIEGGVY